MCYHVALTHADTSTGIRKKNGIRRLALVHTVVIDIVSDVVLANADTHDTVGTDVAYVIAHAGIVAMLLIPLYIGVIYIVSDVVLALLILMIFLALILCM